MTLLVWVTLALLGVAVLLVVLLIVLRLVTGARTRAHTRRRAAVREVVLPAAMGEAEEVDAAERQLMALPARDWRHAEEQIFALLPKVAGDTRQRLVALVQSRGAAQRARRMLERRSVVARCRGAHRLGALRDPDDVARLAAGLDDPSFLVRRVCVRALGSIGDPAAVPALLDAVGEPELARDLVAALCRIGYGACPPLRALVQRAAAAGPAPTAGTADAMPSDPAPTAGPATTADAADGTPSDRTVEVAAIALGLIGDPVAVPALVGVLDHPADGVQAEAAAALGRIGAPQALDALLAKLGSPHERVRRAAAGALGELGDPRAVDGLRAALERDSPLTSRTVAGALLQLGESGREVLRRSASPYAREAEAVHELRAGAR